MSLLVLASRSPRRRALLAAAGIPFELGPFPDCDETWPSGANPGEGVRLLAERKVRAVAALLPERTVLAADTMVVDQGELLGKPRDSAHAARMLTRLSGSRHEVVTGVALARGGVVESDVASTTVEFRALARAEVDAYVATGEGLDKAGAYAIQGGAAAFVARLEGSWDTVIGLPIALVRQLFVRLEGRLGSEGQPGR